MMQSKRNIIIKAVSIIVLLCWTLFPFYWMMSLSIRVDTELMTSLPLIPQSFILDHFISLFVRNNFSVAVINSLQVTLISLFFALCFGLACAYIMARARFQFKLKGFMLFWVLMVRIIPPIAFALPLFIMMNNLGILHTKLPLILSHILINIPFIIWFMISIFSVLPEEIEESAEIDGATEFQLFIRIVLPLALPGIAAVAILSFMTSWNEYLYSLIFVQSPSNFTIPLILSTMNSEQELTQWGSVAAGGLLSLIPIAVFVIFAQNFLLQGLSSGAIKE